MTWDPSRACPKPPKRVKMPKTLCSGVKKYNAKRKGRAFGASCRDDDYLDWLRKYACAICEALGQEQQSPTEAEHWVAKSHGGKDKGDTFPTCAKHREMRHGEPKAFLALLKRLKIAPAKLCRWFAERYDREMYPCP